MRRYLLDTGSASDFIYRRGNVYSRAQARKTLGDVIGICVPVLGELWAGVELSATRARNLREVRRELPAFRLWPFEKAAAGEFGRLFAVLQRMGRPVQKVDLQIAAVAITLGNCTVVTRDSDFTAIPGLAVEDWFGP